MNELIVTKTCTHCKTTKTSSGYNKASKSKDGLQSWCRECSKTNNKKWVEENPVRQMGRTRAWSQQNRHKTKGYLQKYRAAHREEVYAKNALWQKEHPEWRFNKSRHRTQALKKTYWGNEFFISEMYALARLRTKVTGYVWVVDHIVPLKSDFVQGFHVEQNLQVISRVQNSKKYNNTWPDMP